MQTRILGTTMPVLEVLLDPNESVFSESGERRVGKECVRLCRSRWSPYH